MTSWSLCTSAAHSFSRHCQRVFVSPALLRFALGWSTDHVHSCRPGQLLDQATWSPQAGTCSTGITRSLVAQVGWCLVTPDNPVNSCVLACVAGALNLCGHLHRRSAIRVGWVGLKTKWMLFWLISLSQNVASIGSLKDDSCTPKPAKLNACNTSQSDLMKSMYFRCAFFFQTLPKSLRFTCSPQVCLGLVNWPRTQLQARSTPGPSYLVAPGWNLFHRYHPMHSTPKALRGIQRWGRLHEMADGKRWLEGTTTEIGTRWLATKGPEILIYWYHRPNCFCFGYIPSNPGPAKQRGQDGLSAPVSLNQRYWSALSLRSSRRPRCPRTRDRIYCEKGLVVRRGRRAPSTIPAGQCG